MSQLQAQQANVTSGGDAKGSGGSSNYSVGQVVYTTNTGSTGTVAQGIQQSRELYGLIYQNNYFIKISAINNNNNKANQAVSFLSFA